MRYINKKLLTVFLAFTILSLLFTGCSDSGNKDTKPYVEPKAEISKKIVNEVAEKGKVDFEIQNICINNPEYLTKDNDFSFRPSLSLITTENNNTQALTVNIKSPVASNDVPEQGDIVVYISDIANIHYITDGQSYIEIKDSPNKYLQLFDSKYHSYTADIYISKNENQLVFGNNKYYNGKHGTKLLTTQQLK